MKKKTLLAKRLSTYSLVASAFIAASEKANSQLVHVDVVPDDTISSGPNNVELFYLDLNNDGQYDYAILSHCWNGVNNLYIINTYDMAGNAIVAPGAIGYESDRYPDVLNSGDTICSSPHWAALGDSYWGPFGVIYGAGSNYSGMWTGGVTDKFLGIRFYGTNYTWYYGWLRLDVAADGSFAILKDYAYSDSCMTAGEGIALNISGTSHSPIQIFPNPSSEKIFISGLKEFKPDEVLVLDPSGKKLFMRKISAEENQIDVSSLSEGIYFLKLKNKDDVLTRKFEILR